MTAKTQAANGKGTHRQKLFATHNDLPVRTREGMIELLNKRLADGIDLQIQLKQAHWNVKGPDFIALHELFDKVDEAVEAYVDTIAERIAQLGGRTEGTVRMAAQNSSLEEYPHHLSEGMEHVEAVSRVLGAFGSKARGAIDEAERLEDAATMDIFTEIARGIDKWMWFVEAHGQAPR